MSRPTKPQPETRPVVRTAKPAALPPPPLRQFLVRCTYVGEAAKKRLEGSFRFVAEANDAAGASAKLAPAVKKLRRTGELPSQCQVYVDFVVELADTKRGMVIDFERWESEPRRFQHGCVTFSETSPVHQSESNEPAFRFGRQPDAQG